MQLNLRPCFRGEQGLFFIAVLLPNTDAKGARRIADAILGNVRQLAVPHSSSEHGIVTVSVGVATAFANKDGVPSSLITLADTTLYAAKDSGRNQVQANNVSVSGFNRQPTRISAWSMARATNC